MIPIQDLKKIFKKSNRPVAVLHLINLVLNSLTLLAYILLMYSLQADLYPKTGYPSAADASNALQNLPGNFTFNTLVNIIFNVVIMVLAFRNQAKLRKNQGLSEWPYLLGYTLFAINVLSDWITAGITINLFLQIIYLPFYASSRKAARLLNSSL
ncbi:hypothetical protein ACVR1G_03770 [Streptococcus dentasini]